MTDPNESWGVLEWEPGQPRKGVWDMGHKRRFKYSDSKELADYRAGQMSDADFRDWYNNPDHYRPEHPSVNQSHRYE